MRCHVCKGELPNGALACPVCGTRTQGPPPVRRRFTGRVEHRALSRSTVPWAVAVYHWIAVYWIAIGVWGALSATIFAESDGPDIAGIASSLLSAVVGIGLLAKLEFIRGIVNIVCALQILGGLLGVLTAFLAGAPLALFLALAQVATAVLMIFVIGETDDRGPNW